MTEFIDKTEKKEVPKEELKRTSFVKYMTENGEITDTINNPSEFKVVARVGHKGQDKYDLMIAYRSGMEFRFLGFWNDGC